MKVLKELLEQRDAKLAELREFEDSLKVEGQDEPRELTAEEERSSLKLLQEVDGLEERIRDETKREKRQKRIAEARDLVKGAAPSDDGVDAKVESEPMVYGEGSPHSYFADLSRVTAGYGWGVDSGAQARMAEWSHQVEREIADDSKFGREAVVQIRSMKGIRTENGAHARAAVEEIRGRGRVAQDQKTAEVRGIATGGGATASSAGGGGAALVTPIFFVQDTAPFREAGRAFIDRCNKQPLPEYGRYCRI